MTNGEVQSMYRHLLAESVALAVAVALVLLALMLYARATKQ